MNVAVQETALGKIGVAEERGRIVAVYFDGEALPAGAVLRETAVLKEAFRQLHAYMAGELKVFDLPLAPEGTAFQMKVWAALRNIPYGGTASYKDVAAKIGNPKATRAVGMANNRNPIPIMIPCHRVIGADGSLVGFGGGLELKRKLLRIESRNV